METQNKKKATLICRIKPCKNVGYESKLQLCEKHLKIHKEFLENNPSLITKRKSQILGIEYPFLTNNNNKEMEEGGLLPPDEQRCCLSSGLAWRCRNVRMWVDASAKQEDVPDTKFCRQHYIYFRQRNANYQKKKRTTSTGGDGGGASNKRRRRRRKAAAEAEDDDRSLIGEQPATTSDHACDSDKIIEGGSANIRTKRKNVERTRELESLTRTRDPPVVELESLERYKSECVKDETERTILAHATECWRKMFSDLESRVVLMMENVNSAMACVESRISKLETLIGDRQRDKNIKRKPSAQTSSGGRKDSQLKPKENVPNVYDSGLNLVSDDNGDSSGGSSTDSKTSLGDLMEMMAMKYRNENKDKEIKWEFEADMLTSFEDDPELCMKAVCALYRRQISEVEASAKGLFHSGDALRVTSLAKFLMDEDCRGDLKKSVEELEIFDSEAVEDCKRLARRYSKQLFSVYLNGEDPFFSCSYICQP